MVRLLDEHGSNRGMFAHIPAPIEIDDRVATERETFRIVDIAHSYDAKPRRPGGLVRRSAQGKGPPGYGPRLESSAAGSRQSFS